MLIRVGQALGWLRPRGADQGFQLLRGQEEPAGTDHLKAVKVALWPSRAHLLALAHN